MHPNLQAIESAANGLFMMSETDFPFSTIAWPQPGGSIEDMIRQQAGITAGTAVEKTTVEHLFRNMVKADPFAGEAQKQSAERYLHLQKSLLQNLQHPVVYRLGAINIDVFIVGQLPDGSIGGLKTKVVET